MVSLKLGWREEKKKKTPLMASCWVKFKLTNHAIPAKSPTAARYSAVRPASACRPGYRYATLSARRRSRLFLPQQPINEFSNLSQTSLPAKEISHRLITIVNEAHTQPRSRQTPHPPLRISTFNPLINQLHSPPPRNNDHDRKRPLMQERLVKIAMHHRDEHQHSRKSVPKPGTPRPRFVEAQGAVHHDRCGQQHGQIVPYCGREAFC